jgi:flagellar biosynthetic protein FliR
VGSEPVPEVAALPELLPAWTFGFLLVVCRVGAAILALPAFGEAEVTVTIKAAIALAFAAVVWPAVSPGLPPPPVDVARAALLVITECLIGLWIGGLARMVVLILPLAAQFVGFLLGLSSAVLFDPAFGATGTALSRLLGLGAIVLLFATGMHALPLAALAGSYTVLPAGAPFPAAAAAEAFVTTAALTFGLAFQLSGPFVLAGMVFQLAMGVMSRIVPQMQVYFVAMPVQIIGGLALMALVAGAMLGAWTRAAADMLGSLPGL